MLSISESMHLLSRLKSKDFVKAIVRYASNKKKKEATDRALEHFDNVYANIYGKCWWHIRSALLLEETKYIAVVNNFGDVNETITSLKSSGAKDLKMIYDDQYETLWAKRERKRKKAEMYRLEQKAKEAECFVDESVVTSLDTPSHDNDILRSSELSDTESENVKEDRPFGLVELKSIDPEFNEVEINEDRLVDPSITTIGMSEYVPATKIMGFEDDWILESEHYRQYHENKDFQIQVEKENYLQFPEHLKVYMPKKNGDSQFPKPKMTSTGVYDYFLFDGGSILPVLALDLKHGDKVLDMCAAPGGKALAVLQTLTPSFMICNDIMESRTKRIRNIFRQYLPDIDSFKEFLFITQEDGRLIDEADMYNKILVDVPCSTDRHTLHENDNNIFKPSRIKERLRLPEVQSQILMNAIKLVRVGGTVVYSTCSLNPLENDGVVQMALKRVFQDFNHVMVVKDMSEALYPLRSVYTFSDITLRYGHLVVPTHASNCGPMYFCKMTKVQ